MPAIDAADLADQAPDAATPPASAGPASAGGARARSSRGTSERRDKTPKTSTRRGRPAASEKLSSETAAIGAALGQLLSMPGAIFGMIGDPFLGDDVSLNAAGEAEVRPGHFSRTGPAFGMQLAKASETNPNLRRILKSAMSGDSIAVLVLGAIAYAAPPLVYLMTPNESPIRETFGVPARPRKEKSSRRPTTLDGLDQGDEDDPDGVDE